MNSNELEKLTHQSRKAAANSETTAWKALKMLRMSTEEVVPLRKGARNAASDENHTRKRLIEAGSRELIGL